MTNNIIDTSKFGKVFISKTSPEYVIGDYANLLLKAKINNEFSLKNKTFIII